MPIRYRPELHTLLKPSVDHGLLRAVKREDSAGRLRMHWMDPRPFPQQEGQQ